MKIILGLFLCLILSLVAFGQARKPKSKTAPVAAEKSFPVAAKFVEKFGWHIDKSIAPIKVPMEFPKNFNGLPFYHYQSASTSSGVDMTPLLGKKVKMLKYTLREKQTNRGTEITNFAHLIIENGAVVGAWQTDSSGASPGIYSFAQKKLYTGRANF